MKWFHRSVRKDREELERLRGLCERQRAELEAVYDIIRLLGLCSRVFKPSLAGDRVEWSHWISGDMTTDDDKAFLESLDERNNDPGALPVNGARYAHVTVGLLREADSLSERIQLLLAGKEV